MQEPEIQVTQIRPPAQQAKHQR